MQSEKLGHLQLEKGPTNSKDQSADQSNNPTCGEDPAMVNISFPSTMEKRQTLPAHSTIGNVINL